MIPNLWVLHPVIGMSSEAIVAAAVLVAAVSSFMWLLADILFCVSGLGVNLVQICTRSYGQEVSTWVPFSWLTSSSTITNHMSAAIHFVLLDTCTNTTFAAHLCMHNDMHWIASLVAFRCHELVHRSVHFWALCIDLCIGGMTRSYQVGWPFWLICSYVLV